MRSEKDSFVITIDMIAKAVKAAGQAGSRASTAEAKTFWMGVIAAMGAIGTLSIGGTTAWMAIIWASIAMMGKPPESRPSRLRNCNRCSREYQAVTDDYPYNTYCPTCHQKQQEGNDG